MQLPSSVQQAGQQVRQIPFKEIKPIKFLGMSSYLPFSSLISDSRILYFCGRHLILQNIKTYEQKIIWTNEFSNEPQIIEHMNNIHRQNIVAICLNDESAKAMLIIMNINSQINNYEHLNKKEREKDRIHYLKFLEEGQKVERVRLLAEGSLVAVALAMATQLSKPSHEDNQKDEESYQRGNQKNSEAGNSENRSLRRRVVILSSVSGEVLYHSEHLNGPNPCIIESLQLNRISYSCLITNLESGTIKDHGFTPKKSFYNPNSKSSLASQISHRQPCSLYKVTLLASSELSESIKNDFFLELKENQLIIEARFYQNHKKTIGAFLLSSGFVLMYMVNERGLHDCVRVDSRISKLQHQRRMNREKDKAFFRTQKSEQDEKDQSTIEKNQSNANKSKKNSKLQKNDQNYTDNISDGKQSFYFPSCFCFTSCKIVLGYEECSFIGIISYSAVDHRQNKFWYVFDFFFEKTYIQSIRKICFSEDGCHCSVLVKVRKEKVKPGKNKKNSVRIWSKWNARQDDNDGPKETGKTQDKKNRTNTDNSENSKGSSQYTQLSPQNSYPSSFGRSSHRQKKHAHISPKSSFFKPSLQSLVNTYPNVADEQWEQRPHYSILHIDFVSGMIEHEYHSESIEESLTTMGLKGRVEQAEFNSMNNSLLVLMSDSRLFYYSLNMSNICSQKDLLINSGKGHKGSIASLRKKLESASLFSQKSVSNYLSPDQILLWTQKLKVLPHKLLLHPLIFELVIIYSDNIKFHFYNFDKMFECHYVMALKSCKAASYSPNGDKLLVGTLGSVWLVDSYTHAVVKKVQLVVLPNEVKANLNTNMPPRARRPNRGNTIKDPTPTYKTNSNNNDSSNNDTENNSKTNECSSNGPVANPVGPTSSIRRSQSVFVSLSSKTVSHIQFLTAFDLIIQTGNTTLSTLTNYEKIFYYGATSEPIPSKLFCYDYKHRLGVVATETHLKIITKASINSKNKCEELAKVQLQISAIKLCADIDVLFLGSEQGILYFLRWPEFFIGDAVKNPSSYGNSNRLQLFHCAVEKIQISMNYRQLFVVSREGEVIICELSHSDQVQKIGKEVSYRMSKKLDLQLPLLNKWLISTLDEEKRAQNITKLMGNEAEIKNNEVVLAQDYKALLQRQSSQSKTALQVQLKQEIKKYEIDSGIQKLQMDIAFVRDEIRRISGKRQEQSKRRNEEIQKELHDVFVEREKLEKELKEVEAKVQRGREGYRQQMQHEQKQYCQLTNMQVQEKDRLLAHSEFMFDKKFKIDMAMSEHLKEDFLDELFELQKSFAQQLQHLYQENNSLVSQNRNLKVQSVELTQKLREMQARMLQVEGDCSQLQIQKDRVGQVRKTLETRIQETDKKYHGLIKRTKQLQINLNQIRTSSEACQLKFNDLQRQLQILQQKNSSLETHHQQAELDFIHQSKLRNMNTTQQDQLRNKILELKSKRKKVFEYNVLLKDLIKPYEKNTQHSKDFNEQKLQSEDIQNFERVVEWKRQKTDKLTSDVQKWKLVKDDNKIKFIKYNQKLQEQNNKLVFRFNELQKEAKQLKKLQNHLKRQVQIEKMKQQKLLLGSTEGQRNYFLPKANDSFYNDKKASLSFKREGLEKQKLPSASYHLSSTQSLQRQSNFMEQKAPFSLNKNNKRNLIKQLISKEQSTTIAKKSLLPSWGKHRESQTDGKENKGNYHGVFLDRQTLKPKKTLCLSLHSDGDMTKFVTES